MLDQTTALILAAAIGASASIISGLVIPYVTQRLHKHEEKRKFTLEKVEEIYFLAADVKLWIDTQLWLFTSRISPIPMQTPQEVENPLHELAGLAMFYAPSLEPEVMLLSKVVAELHRTRLEWDNGMKAMTRTEVMEYVNKHKPESDEAFENFLSSVKKLIKTLSK